ncbi:TPA: TIGR00341 family protein, partial [Legionella pneumophila]|nr:TIGR00341 family protein [Legionella pneumophila]HAT9278681.1 TIGR00341 family protein [Legionella pneumophila subsp. pneumophila]HAT5055269.1 TIGR00341 family protein [Legionella pneumophila]HAT6335101.1 TIGR00341 family protein [Legionella pneumophila]HAT7936987.1 TIGR00341 family protein [Legionella pneumophila]
MELPVTEVTEQKAPDKISREELYEDIKNLARFSLVYLAMIVLSTIVASVGLHNNSVAIIIGAMVIAPMLGPSIALALGTTLGDLTLLKQAILTGLAGITAVIILSTIIGAIVEINPSLTEIASRTHVGLGDVAVALASGCAGA